MGCIYYGNDTSKLHPEYKDKDLAYLKRNYLGRI